MTAVSTTPFPLIKLDLSSEVLSLGQEFQAFYLISGKGVRGGGWTLWSSLNSPCRSDSSLVSILGDLWGKNDDGELIRVTVASGSIFFFFQTKTKKKGGAVQPKTQLDGIQVNQDLILILGLGGFFFSYERRAQRMAVYDSRWIRSSGLEIYNYQSSH